MTVNIRDVRPGFAFEDAKVRLSAPWVSGYLRAVGDSSGYYEDKNWVPPMAILARSLTILMQQMVLPDGALHAAQEVTSLKPARINDDVIFRARVSQSGIRGGWQLLILDIVADDVEGDPVMHGRITLSIPVEEEP